MFFDPVKGVPAIAALPPGGLVDVQRGTRRSARRDIDQRMPLTCVQRAGAGVVDHTKLSTRPVDTSPLVGLLFHARSRVKGRIHATDPKLYNQRVAA